MIGCKNKVLSGSDFLLDTPLFLALFEGVYIAAYNNFLILLSDISTYSCDNS